jgi:hypothetical protein
MRKTHGKSGRPRSAQRTALVAALVDRQDALSRRRARQLRALLGVHVAAEDVGAERETAERITRETLQGASGTLASAVCRARPLGEHHVATALAEGLRRALHAAADALEAAPVPARGRRGLSAPRVRTSRGLPEARAQAARLAVQLDDVRTAIADGQLVPIAPLERETFDAARTRRDAVLNLPPRLAGPLAVADDVAVAAMLTAALTEALA